MNGLSLLEMKEIEKSFGSVKVLHGINFTLKEGTVHALMGENGAGKSTMMKILAGIYKYDEGIVAIQDQPMEFQTPKQAQDAGIAMIHQELSAIPEMTVAENIFLGREPRKGLFIDYKKMWYDTEAVLENLGVSINPRQKIGKLKLADQQLVEIAKAISLNAEIIVMDEPTSAITDKEVDLLFQIIEELKKQKKGIIYISHKMDEIFKIADDITVLRDGHYVNSWPAEEIDDQILIKNMVGRELNEIYPKAKAKIENVLLEVKRFSKEGQFEDISFGVRRGEILGLAGLVGAGRTELMHTIFGLTKPDEGELYLNGEKIEIHKPKDAIGYKIAYVTEDRKLEGLVLEMGVGANITLSSMKELSNAIFVNSREEQRTIVDQIKQLHIKTSNHRQKVGSLSGGNQQKVVLAKWMMKDPKLLILDEPTRGIDVGAKSEIYKLMGEFVRQGNAIIMISSEMPEVMGMSDRILVMSNGVLSGELKKDEFNQEQIMQMAVSNI